MWFTAIVAAVFTWWANFQIVIAGVSGLAAYTTYVMVVGCALRDRPHKWQLSGDPSQSSIVPRPLGIVALIWLLTCLGALTLPSSAWINDKAILVGLALGLCIWLVTHKRRRTPETQTEAGEVIP
jgi:amino acid transporter